MKLCKFSSAIEKRSTKQVFFKKATLPFFQVGEFFLTFRHSHCQLTIRVALLLDNNSILWCKKSLSEQLKTLPFGDIWEEFCRQENVAQGFDWIADIEKKYEKEVLSKRG